MSVAPGEAPGRNPHDEQAQGGGSLREAVKRRGAFLRHAAERRGAFLRHAVELTRQSVPPIHPAGKPFVLGGLAATTAARARSRRLGLLTGLGTLATAAFFREPPRVPPTETGLVVAAADGLVAGIDEAEPPAELGLCAGARQRVSIFLSVLDVHVQRMPVAGTVERIAYRKGRFLSADLDKASADNERNSMLLRTETGHELAAVQIAGLVARRIVCQASEGQTARTGETYGLIRFGSRVDTYLPKGSRILVRTGQRALGGETALAELPTTPERL